MSPEDGSARDKATPAWRGALAVFLLALPLFGWLFARFPVLYDTDSYYHLAIARAYWAFGDLEALPWARFSIFFEAFADKEWLFHQLLAPWTAIDPATLGGRWALAFLNALTAALIAWLGAAAIGPWGLAAPLLVYGGSMAFLSRAIRLRPELLALILFLLAIWAAARGKERVLGLITAVFTVSYTAFQAMVGLCGLFFLQQGLFRKQWRWGLVVYPALGAGLGLILHPHFPQNLVVWKIQNVDFFQQKTVLNVGTEIRAPQPWELLADSWGWWAAMASIVVLSLFRRQGARADEGIPAVEVRKRTADFLAVAAITFAILYVSMLRFVTYFVPLATLALFWRLDRRSSARARHVIPVAMALCLLVGAGPIYRLLDGLGSGSGSPLEREDDWAAFGASVPSGAKIAAEWGSTALYMYWAPQATYLNVLDPVFMAVRYPEAYRHLRSVFEGREPDIAPVLAAELDSDHIALSRFHRPSSLPERLAADPRFRRVYEGHTLLYELVPGAAEAFVRDWRVVPAGARLPPPADVELEAWSPYPRAQEPRRWVLEGFVDAARLGTRQGCVALVHQREVAYPLATTFEIATMGPTRIWVDAVPVAEITRGNRAHLGGGFRFPVAWEPGNHRISLLTCQPEDTSEEESSAPGFFLVDRADSTLSRQPSDQAEPAPH